MPEPFDFMQLAAARYSVRKFSKQPIEKDVMRRILAVGHLAPTACNRQPQRILVIDSAENLEKLKRCTNSHFDAPCALLVCHDKDACWKREYDKKPSGDIDAAIVTTQMMLEAFAQGVGSTWVMHFIPEAVRAEFAVPENYEPTALLVMGYPAEDAKPSPGHSTFLPEAQIVSYNAFGCTEE